MRIAMIISTAFPPEEGIGFYVYNLSRKLIEKGHEVTVITRGSLKTQREVFEGIKIIKVLFVPLYPFHVHIHGYFVNNLFKSIEKEFDIVHIHSPLSPVIDINIPIVGTIHTSLVEDLKHFQANNLTRISNRLTTDISGRPLTQKLIDKSKCITTVSSSVAEELKKYYAIENALVLGNGVNENVFYPKKNKEFEPYLLYVGRLDYRKGIQDLIEASILLKKLQIKLLVAGKGPLKKNFEREIAKNTLNVKLLGQVSGKNLIKLYQNAFIFVFPSHYEGLPTVVLEAMSCGLPLLLADISAYKDFIINNFNGLYAQKGNPEDFVNKIRILLEDDDLREKLGENARNTIENNFTWDIVSGKFEKIYINSLGEWHENCHNLLCF